MAEKIPEELELLNEWKQRLGLQDWHIYLFTKCKPEDLTVKQSDGCVSYTEVTKYAEIQIVDPEQREKGALNPFDFEETLVHELMHLKLCLFEEGSDWDENMNNRVLHQTIEDMAKALVSAKRDGAEKKSTGSKKS